MGKIMAKIIVFLFFMAFLLWKGENE